MSWGRLPTTQDYMTEEEKQERDRIDSLETKLAAAETEVGVLKIETIRLRYDNKTLQYRVDMGSKDLAEIRRLREALKFYADPKHYHGTYYNVQLGNCPPGNSSKWNVVADGGAKARATLETK